MILENCKIVNKNNEIIALNDFRNGIDVRTDFDLLVTEITDMPTIQHLTKESAVACHLIAAAVIHKKYKDIKLFPPQVGFLN